MQGMKLINKYVLTANTLLEMECVQYCKFLIQHLIQKNKIKNSYEYQARYKSSEWTILHQEGVKIATYNNVSGIIKRD